VVHSAAKDQEIASTGRGKFTQGIGALGTTCAAIYSATPHSTGASTPRTSHTCHRVNFSFSSKLRKASKVKKV